MPVPDLCESDWFPDGEIPQYSFPTFDQLPFGQRKVSLMDLVSRCRKMMPATFSFLAFLSCLFLATLPSAFGQGSFGGPGRGYVPQAPPRTQSSSGNFTRQPFVKGVETTNSPQLQQPVVNVLIEGNETIPRSAILQHVGSRPGRMASPSQIREDVRRLYQTRWFFSVEPRYRLTEKGLVLVFGVVERPMVRSVRYQGNKSISTRKLAALTGIRPGSPYDMNANRESIRRIEENVPREEIQLRQSHACERRPTRTS